MTTSTSSPATPRTLYDETVELYGAALARLARSYELDRDRRQDLLQEIHLALWRSFERFDSRCSLRTWVYRVAHNVATTHVVRDRRQNGRAFLTLDAVAELAAPESADAAAEHRILLGQVDAVLRQLNPIDRQVMLLYLEGLDAASIGEVTSLSARNVATKVHRIKKVLAQRMREPSGGAHA